jgi:uncharacterized protein YabE (DUF348 family)
VTTRTLIKAAPAAITLALAAGAASAVSMDKTVTVVVDDEARTVHTYGASVSDVLESAGLRADSKDALAPTADSKVDDGSRIVLKRGKPIALNVDGAQREVWTTATTVDGALRQLGMHAEGAQVSADRSRRIPLQGMALQVRIPRAVTVIDGGQPPRGLSSTAMTVGELLAQQGTPLGQQDTVAPVADAPVTPGMTIEVTRVHNETRVERESVDIPVEEVEDPQLASGEEVVDSPGKAGERMVTYRILMSNGHEIGREKLGSKDVTPASPRRIRVGPEVKAPAVSSGSAWDRLASCESGGDWSTNSGNGYYGGLQFDKSTWDAYGGDQYAAYPHQASREEQIAVAEKVRDSRGNYGAWPTCSSEAGLA